MWAYVSAGEKGYPSSGSVVVVASAVVPFECFSPARKGEARGRVALAKREHGCA